MSDTDGVDLPSPQPAAPTCSSTSTVPPVLSTLEDTTSFLQPTRLELDFIPRTDDEIRHYFEIEKTIEEVHQGGWKRIALQFSDELLQMRATRCYELLQEGLSCRGGGDKKLYILADTSYGSCCVDEIAAEHVSAEVVVHYGRACLSPTTRLPVIYVFTKPPLLHQGVINAFNKLFPNPMEKVILMADVSYTSHLPMLVKALREHNGYMNIWETKVLHCPGALLPNRTLPKECTPVEGESEDAQAEKARSLREEWSLFHVGTPLPALLLVLASRIPRIHIIPTRSSMGDKTETEPIATLPLLRRRYALLTHLRSASIIGILVSTLTVKNYLPLISLLQRLIRSRGKKSYMVVVGKVNPEKLANFGEVEGWVGVGCWEQGVVGGALEKGDGGKSFWRGVVTPWELGVALGGLGVNEEAEEESRGKRWEWNGEWITDFDTLLAWDPTIKQKAGGGGASSLAREAKLQSSSSSPLLTPASIDDNQLDPTNPLSHLPESLPPDYDLRTGRYTGSSRPLDILPSSVPSSSTCSTINTNAAAARFSLTTQNQSTQLIIPTGGVVSPAGEFLQEKRTWKGLVVEYEEEEDWGGSSGGGDGSGSGNGNGNGNGAGGGVEGARIEVGRSGIAKGYTLGLGGARSDGESKR